MCNFLIFFCELQVSAENTELLQLHVWSIYKCSYGCVLNSNALTFYDEWSKGSLCYLECLGCNMGPSAITRKILASTGYGRDSKDHNYNYLYLHDPSADHLFMPPWTSMHLPPEERVQQGSPKDPQTPASFHLLIWSAGSKCHLPEP